eukprot:EC723241.1.p1 GENE.EC723241.1~~EC723241.1.p1  ORF type:complete len:104 (+),score=3.23 EC723241.1:26-313(+)
MSIITEWIQSLMADPSERDRKFHEFVRSDKRGADQLRHVWSQPRFGPGYWRHPKMNLGFQEDKKWKPVINPYDQLLGEIDAARQRQRQFEEKIRS